MVCVELDVKNSSVQEISQDLLNFYRIADFLEFDRIHQNLIVEFPCVRIPLRFGHFLNFR